MLLLEKTRCFLKTDLIDVAFGKNPENRIKIGVQRSFALIREFDRTSLDHKEDQTTYRLIR